MQLDSLRSAAGSEYTKHRAGCDIGSDLGKAAGRGYEGQKSRSGSFHKAGFEGGQMPLYRRLPERSFISLTREFVTEVRLGDLTGPPVGETNLLSLRQANLAGGMVRNAKTVLPGEIDKKAALKDIDATAGAKAAIEAAGGLLA